MDKAVGDLGLYQTSLLSSCKCRPGHQGDNCKNGVFFNVIGLTRKLCSLIGDSIVEVLCLSPLHLYSAITQIFN